MPINPKIQELGDSLKHIGHFVELLKSGELSYAKPLAVELRKLYCGGRGNNLLKRIEQDLGIKLIFQVRAEPRIPPTYKGASIDEYLKESRFFDIRGKDDMYNREEIIRIVANQKGAHVDDAVDAMHQITVPFGNNLPASVVYLAEIANMTLRVCNSQIFKN